LKFFYELLLWWRICLSGITSISATEIIANLALPIVKLFHRGEV